MAPSARLSMLTVALLHLVLLCFALLRPPCLAEAASLPLHGVHDGVEQAPSVHYGRRKLFGASGEGPEETKKEGWWKRKKKDAQKKDGGKNSKRLDKLNKSSKSSKWFWKGNGKGKKRLKKDKKRGSGNDEASKKVRSLLTDLQRALRARESALRDLRLKAHGEGGGESSIRDEFGRTVGSKGDIKSGIKAQIAFEEDQFRKLQEDVNELRREADDPAFSKWLQKRVEGLADLIDLENSGGQALGKAVADVLEDARVYVESFEASIERHVASPRLAVLISLILLVVPIVFVMWALSFLTRTISMQQHVLLAQLFNVGFLASAICIQLVTSYDPIASMRTTSPHYWLMLELFFFGQWCLMFSFMAQAAASTIDSTKRFFLVMQLQLFVCLCVHVRVVALDRMRLEESNLRNYVLYLLTTGCMIVLLVSCSERKEEAPDVLQITTYAENFMDSIVSFVHCTVGGYPRRFRKTDPGSFDEEVPKSPMPRSSSALNIMSKRK